MLNESSLLEFQQIAGFGHVLLRDETGLRDLCVDDPETHWWTKDSQRTSECHLLYSLRNNGSI